MVDDRQFPRLVSDATQGTPVALWLIRAAFLLVAATASVSALFVLFQDKGGAHQTRRYVCPMHPEISRSEPGECPICNMALELQAPQSSQHPSVDGLAQSIAAEAAELRRHDIVDTVKKRALARDVRDALVPAWVEHDGSIAAIVYNDVASTMVADEPATFTTTAKPRTSAKLGFVGGSTQHWDRSTSKIRFTLDERELQNPLAKGASGWIKLSPKPREVLIVPSTAVIQSSTGPYVLASSEDGTRFAKRDIQIGETYEGLCLTVVLSGLKERERIVARNTFFVESERRLQLSSAEQGRM